MKRIGGLKQQVGAGLHNLTVDGRTPEQQIAECVAVITAAHARSCATTYAELRDALARARHQAAALASS